MFFLSSWFLSPASNNPNNVANVNNDGNLNNDNANNDDGINVKVKTDKNVNVKS